MTSTRNTQIALFSLRLSLFILMVAWAYLKVKNPASYAGDGGDNGGIFGGFYGLSFGQNIVLIMGVAQIVFLLAYLAGLFKTITVGGVLLMNTITLLVSMPKIINMYQDKNILFVASVPIFAASLAHFMMRKDDTFLSLGK